MPRQPCFASVAYYVANSGEAVVLSNVAADPRFSKDPYSAIAPACSLLCQPIMQGGVLKGILYLENDLSTDAFTQDRVVVIQMLTAQAAISLTNAALFQEVAEEAERRLRAAEELKKALEEVESLKNRLHAENVYLQEEIEREHDFKEVVGNSPELRNVLAQVGQVAGTDVTVLIYGETGTGKELIARAIHDRSSRQGRPLVKVNCGAISPGLVESELFGHVRGAFTGAIDKRVGRFELAHGSTIFLDEVGELPMDTQVKLLRVLQEHEFEPVGSSKTIKVDIRVIVATNRNLKEEVAAGRFRADLYYRLNVFPITVPALRQRRSDIPLLAMYFLRRFAREMGREIQAISQNTIDRLIGYAWPGNIRELQNVIERAVVLSSGETLTVGEDALPNVDLPIPASFSEPAAATPAVAASLKSVERDHIVAAVDRANWVIEGPEGAAAILGLHPNTLRSRLKKMNISRPS